MTRSYRVTSDAERDLIQIEEYVDSYAGADGVDEFEKELLKGFARVCANPHAYPVYQFEPPMPTLHEYRSFNVRRFEVFYWLDGNTVEIYRIRHLVSDFTRLAF